MSKTGVWVIGVSGSVATTAMAGAIAIARGKAQPSGLVTELPELNAAKFCGLGSLVFGGHEIRKPDLIGELESLQASSKLLSDDVISLVSKDFRKIQTRVRPGTAVGGGKSIDKLVSLKLIDAPSASQVVDKIRRDLDNFRRNNGLDRLIVVDLQSTEPPFPKLPCHKSLAKLRKALAMRGPSPLPASSLYCMAALEGGDAFVNFTPSLGPNVPAFQELAEETGGLMTGSDGKTGETMCKSTIAPLFAMRNLKVLSWVGHNILGNRDAVVLDDPKNKSSKVQSKDHLIQSILGYAPKTLVTIENIPSMGDWKTAWDHIHFEGFLGMKMVMQFIWQGCDSILAAPLVLDLIRLAELAQRRGERGVMKQTACFFKSPLGVGEDDSFKQFRMLVDYVHQQ